MNEENLEVEFGKLQEILDQRPTLCRKPETDDAHGTTWDVLSSSGKERLGSVKVVTGKTWLVKIGPDEETAAGIYGTEMPESTHPQVPVSGAYALLAWLHAVAMHVIVLAG